MVSFYFLGGLCVGRIAARHVYVDRCFASSGLKSRWPKCRGRTRVRRIRLPIFFSAVLFAEIVEWNGRELPVRASDLNSRWVLHAATPAIAGGILQSQHLHPRVCEKTRVQLRNCTPSRIANGRYRTVQVRARPVPIRKQATFEKVEPKSLRSELRNRHVRSCQPALA